MEHSFLDKYSDLDSFLHRLDSRVKIVTFSIFLLFILATPLTEKGRLFAYFLLILFLIFLSRIPILYIFKRSLVILPFVFLLSFFNLLYQRFWILGLIFKSWLAILVLILLSSTTKFSLLLKGMGKLYFPKILLTLSSFMYRYLFLLTDEAMRMQRAWNMRYFGKNRLGQVKIISNLIATLFIRAYERAERVYQAMCARGYNGEIITFDDFKISRKEIIFSFIFLSILFILIHL